MNYTKELLPKSQLKLVIDLTHDEWETELDHVYEHNKSKYVVQGFRKGKTPRAIIEKAYGSTVFYDEGINHAFYEYFDEILREEPDLEPVSTPSLEVKKLDETGITLAVTYTIKPEVTLGKYTEIELEKPEVKVTVAEVNAEIKNALEKSARFVKVERPAKLTDTVSIDFVGKLDGVKFDGGSAEKYDLVLGSNSFVPGFEEQVVGMKAGDKKTIEVTFPQDYPAENLKGKKTTFDVTINDVREKVVPEMDDEWAKNISEFDTLAEYKANVKKELLAKKEQKAKTELETKLIDTITENATVEIPEAMVDAEVDGYIHNFEHSLSHQGLKLEDYLKYAKTTLEDLKKSRREDAQKTSKTRLVLEAIIKKEDIKVEPKELDDEITHQAESYGITAEEFRKHVDEHQISHILNDLLIEKLLNFLRTKNNI